MIGLDWMKPVLTGFAGRGRDDNREVDPDGAGEEEEEGGAAKGSDRPGGGHH